LTTKSTLQQSGSAGEGVGKFSSFFTFVAQIFNDKDFNAPFPKEHIPQHLTLLNANVRPLIKCHIKNVTRFQKQDPKVFAPPQLYARGLFAGLDLMSARRPEGFVDEFFNHEKLSEIWDEALKIYRSVEARYDASGNHGSVPRYVCMYACVHVCNFYAEDIILRSLEP
jgi:hypothetical protein